MRIVHTHKLEFLGQEEDRLDFKCDECGHAKVSFWLDSPDETWFVEEVEK